MSLSQQQDRQHCFHPFSNYHQLNRDGARVIVKGEGIYVYDEQGNKILDAMAGLWCVNLGYSAKPLIEAAQKQFNTLPYYNLFFQTTHSPAAKLAAKLAEITPAKLNHVFFTGSGSECNDTVLRTVRHYWACLGQPQKQIVISRDNAYHGSTMAGASLGGMKPMHAQGGLPIPGIVHIPQPYHFGEGQGVDVEMFGQQRAQLLEQKILELGVENVAAFIAEPIQGAGGVIIPPDSYWPEIQRICDHYGILLIVDEVICGFGRTGEWFASQTYAITPDLMCLAKGITSGYLPLGAVMVSDRIAQVLQEHDDEFTHGFTYSGHPVACAVALATIEEMEKNHLVEKVRNDIAPYLAQKWLALAEHPLVGEARIKGMMAAIELVENKATLKRYNKTKAAGTLCRNICVSNGLIMRAVGDTMIIAPPLIISKAEVDELIQLAWQCLDQTYAQLTSRTNI
ncbi:aspartate aminotransferase family protein [Celerinatantimonas yamalensis]|uniref:Aspartate aminotransferase family protein n=1 Tax=Celerinatantimonas yamalensis TaxID=559956 RepID=A0ABW9G7C3_9GAMM